MRIHSDSLNRKNIMDAVPYDDVDVYVVSTHRSHTHRNAFEVALRGIGARHKRAPQGRVTGDPSSEKAATYEDWGRFLGSLYKVDHSMIAGPYKSRADFRSQTKGKF